MPGAWQIGIVLAVFFGSAAFIWLMRRHFIRRFGVPPSRFPWICGGLAVFGIVFVLAASIVVRATESPVIFQARLAGTSGMREGDPAVARTARFAVSHPGREHFVGVRAVPAKGVAVAGPVRLRLSLVGPDETTALADTDLVLPVRSGLSRLSLRPQWEPGFVPFRPTAAGRYAMRLVPLNPGIGRFEVRVTESGGR